MANPIRRLVNRTRNLLRAHGWDIVRYKSFRPLWPTLLGLERLPIRTVLDIGAYDGDTARIFRRYFPQATIHCFEPQPQPFHALAEWAAKQDNHVHCYQFALGDRTEQADLLMIPSRLKVSSLLPSTSWRITNKTSDHPMLSASVKICRLDDVFANLSLTDDVLVKIDTEGFDKRVVMGGMAVLRNAAACIVEVLMKQRFACQPTFHELIDLLEEAELKYVGNLHQAVGQNGSIVWFDALFIKQDLLPIFYFIK
jgi:FkbM family methyltransferase